MKGNENLLCVRYIKQNKKEILKLINKERKEEKSLTSLLSNSEIYINQKKTDLNCI